MSYTIEIIDGDNYDLILVEEQGPTGATGATGPTGPQGPVGIIDVATVSELTSLANISNGDLVECLGYYASGDGGGQTLVYRSTGRGSITIDSVFFFVGPGSVDYFEALDKSVVYGKRAGIKADGTTNDSARFQAALNATQLGYTSILELQTGVIKLTSQVTLTVLNTLIIRGNNATILKDGTAIEIYGNAQANLTLAATVANRSTTITVSNAANVGVGDIVCIYSNDNVETAWGYKANDTRKVIKITGNVLTMDSECNFDYTTGDMIGVGVVRHWKKSKVVIEQLRFETLTQVSTNGRHLHLIGVSGNASDIFCRGNRVQNAIDIWYSVDFEFNRVQLENGAYGIGIDFCRFISVHDLKAVDYLAHPVVPASWTSHTYVNGLVLQNSEAGIDSHPAINVIYDNVTQTNANAPNVRAYGVTLRNCQFTMAVAPPNPFDICLGVGSTKPRYNYLLSQFDIVLDNVVYTPPASTLYDSVIIITGPCRRLIVDSCTLSGLLIEGDCEEISIQSSKLGYLSQRFAGKQSLVGVEFDWNLHKYRNDPTRVHTTSPVLWNNVNCSNYPSSGTLFGYVFIKNFSAVNCNFGLLEDLASNQTGKPTGYLFANCKIEATNDNEFNVDTSRFVNCIGSIGGQSLTDIGNSFARFNGTTDFATIPDFSIGNGTSGTVLARVRHSGVNTVSGPFNFIYNAPFYYIHPSTNIWCGDLRSTWVENFTSDTAIPKTAWHWIVIRTDVTNGWEFLQATDAGTLSPRAAAAHENFTVPSSYGVIGKNRSGSEFWDGDIDRLLAFPTRLSNAQIQEIIAGGVGTGASLRYGFGAIKSNQFIDSSLNSLHATIVGTPTIIPLGGSLTIAEVDGTPSDDIWKLIVPNGSLVVADGIATLTVGGGTTIVGITGTKAQFDTACTDGDFAYQSDLASYPTKANNLSDLASATTARTNLGLGSLATQSGTFSGTSSNTNTGDQDLSSYATTAYVVAGYIPLATSVANRIPKRSGTTGLLTDSGITIDASNNVTGVVALSATGAVTISNGSTAPLTVSEGSMGGQAITCNGTSALIALTRSGMISVGLGTTNGDSFRVSNIGDSTAMLTIHATTKLATFPGAITASGTVTLTSVVHGTTTLEMISGNLFIGGGLNTLGSISWGNGWGTLSGGGGAPVVITAAGATEIILGKKTTASAGFDVTGNLTASGLVTAASINLGGSTVTDILTATATLNFASILAGGFEDLTISVTGAVVGSTAVANPPVGSVTNNITYDAWVSAADVVTVRASNNNLITAMDPASGTFRATVFNF